MLEIQPENKPKILIVEDEAVIALHLQDILENEGYEVLDILNDGELAVEQVETNPPDLILMDIVLAGKKDGIETAEQIRSLIPVPIIFTTAFGEEQKINLAKFVEPFGYVLKPFSDRNILLTVEMALYRSNFEKEKKKADKILYESQRRYINLVESITDSICVLDHNLSTVMVNSAAEKYYDLPKSRLLGKTLADLFPGSENSSFCKLFEQVLKSGNPDMVTDEFTLKDGRKVWYEARVYPVPEGIMCVARDITARMAAEKELEAAHDELETRVAERTSELASVNKQLHREIIERHRAQEKLEGMNQKLRALYEASQAISKAQTEQELLRDICEIIVEFGGYRLAWVGYAEDDENRTVRPVAQTGYEDNYLDTVQITWSDESSGQGPAGTAIKTGTPYICKNIPTDPAFEPWRAEALKRGYASSIALPLSDGVDIFGALNVYAMEPGGFDPDEVQLLKDLAENVSLGVKTLRARKEGEQARRELKESELRYRTVADFTYDWEYWVDPKGGYQYISPSCEQITGYGINEFIDNKNFLLTIVHPDDREMVAKHLIEESKTQIVYHQDFRIFNKSGNVIWISHYCQPVFGPEGNWLGRRISNRDITARKKIEEALSASETRYRNLVETSRDLIWRMDRNGRFTYLNPAWEKVLGYKPEEMLGRNFLDFKPLAQIPESKKRFSEIKDQSFSSEYETIYLAKSGEEVYLRFNVTPTFDDQGNVVGTQGTAFNITARIHAEAALRESEEKYRTVVERATDGISIVQDETIKFVNPALADMLGYSEDELIGRYHLDLTPLDEIQKTKERFDRRMAGESLEPRVSSVKHKDGQLIYVEIRGGLIEYNGKPANLSFHHNVTDKVKAEEALRESEERYRTYVNNSPMGVFIADEKGNFIDVNPAACELTGYSADELTSMSFRDLLTASSLDEGIATFEELVTTGKTSGERKVARKDGSEFFLSIESVKLSDNKLISFCQDITHRIESEQQARQQQEQLFQASKMVALGTLVSGVAHEINNPTTFVTLNAPILKQVWSDILPLLDKYEKENGDFSIGNLKYSEIRDEIPKLLEDILGGARRIKRIVEDLKDFARPESDTAMKDIDLNAIVKSSLNLVSNQIKKSTKRFSVEYAENLPIIKGSSQKLEQVVINLIQNACEALPDTGCAISLKTVYKAEKNMVAFKVQDEGCGIPREILPRLMDPFFTTKRDSGGTGLGLSISSTIVREHNGELTFSSEPGRGTTALLSLPVPENE